MGPVRIECSARVHSIGNPRQLRYSRDSSVAVQVCRWTLVQSPVIFGSMLRRSMAVKNRVVLTVFRIAGCRLFPLGLEVLITEGESPCGVSRRFLQKRLRWLHVGAIDGRCGWWRDWSSLAVALRSDLGRAVRFWREARPARRPGVDAAAAERGRVALTLKGFLKPEWSEAVYRNAARLWDQPAPDPDKDPAAMPRRSAIATACTRPPFPTTGCRWACAGVSARAV